MLISSFIVTTDEGTEKFYVADGSEQIDGLSQNQPFIHEFEKAKNDFSSNAFVEYHVSEDILRKSTQHTMRGMNLIDENGQQVVMDFEPTQVFPVYYTPGSFPYGASAFVPSYEEAVKLSEVKPLLERDIDPLSWSWSAETNKQPELYNTGNPIDLKPIIKEDIPVNRILPTGYFMLKKSKTLDKFQIGMIPEGFYIYDESNMARIPPGFQASVDKMYIFRKSDAIDPL